MKLWDVNLWVYAFRKESPRHTQVRDYLEDSLSKAERFLFSPSVAASFLRLVTNPRIFVEPSSLEEAWSFIDFLENRPSAFYADMDAMSFGIFKHLCHITQARANAVPDVLLAALAIRNDAVLVTADADFKRFAALKLDLIK